MTHWPSGKINLFYISPDSVQTATHAADAVSVSGLRDTLHIEPRHDGETIDNAAAGVEK